MNLEVIVHPNSKKPRIDKDLLGTLHVYVSAPPLEGRANQAVIEALADYFKVKKYQVAILKGQSSKHKIVKVGN